MTFIVIDGLDGSGKSTQAELICRRIAEGGGSYVLRAHPSGDNFFGRLGRGYLLMEGKTAKIAASLFYMLDVIRSILLYWWRPVDYVVFVRYLMGTAYLPSPLHRVAYLFFLRAVPTSSHMYFIDVSPAEAHHRIETNRSQKEMFESLEKLEEIREKVLELAGDGRWVILDGDQPMMNVNRQLSGLIGLTL